jgi:hypothetical protein
MHYTEDDLILYYYGEHRRRRRDRVERHLAACKSCAAAYRAIGATLDLIAAPAAPERGEEYGLEVWQRIRHGLPEQDTPWWRSWTGGLPWPRLAFAAGLAGLLLAAFAAGRMWPSGGHPAAVQSAEFNAGSTERVRLAAIGDHLEQSERVLLDLLNAQGTPAHPADVSDQQAWAADLITANRLYRDASEQAGDDPVAALLDELERHLLEIAHGPASLTPAQLDGIRVRLDAAALLFKVRVLSEELRERELAPMTPRKTT